MKSNCEQFKHNGFRAYMPAVFGILVVLSCCSISAADAAKPPELPAGGIMTAVQLASQVTPVDVCSSADDYVSCTSPQVTYGFLAELHYQFPFPWLALGLSGGVTFAPNDSLACGEAGCVDQRHEYSLWHTALDLKLIPLVKRWGELWLGVEAGLAGAVFQYHSQIAPMVGAGAGLDFFIGRYFFIGLEARALFMGFGTDNTHREIEGLYNTGWVSFTLLKLGLRFSLGNR